MDTWQRRYYLYIKCSCCGTDIFVDKTKQSVNKTGMYFCSISCANKILLDKDHNPNYKGISDIASAIRHYYEKNQRGLIFKRDNKTCLVCNGKAEEVHHIYPLFKIIEDFIECHPNYNIKIEEDRINIINDIINDKTNIFNDFDNMMCVCKSCHDKVYHSGNWKDNFKSIKD